MSCSGPRAFSTAIVPSAGVGSNSKTPVALSEEGEREREKRERKRDRSLSHGSKPTVPPLVGGVCARAEKGSG